MNSDAMYVRCSSLDEGKELLQPLIRKYMRCSTRVTIYHLKKFLARKLEVPPTHEVRITIVLVQSPR